MEWIGVEDRLPRIDQFVIWYSVEGNMGIWEIDKDDDMPWLKEVTHWMPLPEPPEITP